MSGTILAVSSRGKYAHLVREDQWIFPIPESLCGRENVYRKVRDTETKPLCPQCNYRAGRLTAEAETG